MLFCPAVYQLPLSRWLPTTTPLFPLSSFSQHSAASLDMSKSFVNGQCGCVQQILSFRRPPETSIGRAPQYHEQISSRWNTARKREGLTTMNPRASTLN